MPTSFFQRLREYYLEVAAVLRGEAKAASIFPNSTDVGATRERIYAEFLRQHAPSKCNVSFGGFLFGENGDESGQLDVIITTDTTPRFNFHNKDGQGKTFSPVEGTLGVASIKSTLDKKELWNALEGIAAIPPSAPLVGRVNPQLNLPNQDDWPYKIIYASDGISHQTLLDHTLDFYARNPSIPNGRRPNLIHVSGRYVIFRAIAGMSTTDQTTGMSRELPIGEFTAWTRDSDLQAILWVLHALQQRATASAHILYSYNQLINQVGSLST